MDYSTKKMFVLVVVMDVPNHFSKQEALTIQKLMEIFIICGCRLQEKMKSKAGMFVFEKQILEKS